MNLCRLAVALLSAYLTAAGPFSRGSCLPVLAAPAAVLLPASAMPESGAKASTKKSKIGGKKSSHQHQPSKVVEKLSATSGAGGSRAGSKSPVPPPNGGRPAASKSPQPLAPASLSASDARAPPSPVAPVQPDVPALAPDAASKAADLATVNETLAVKSVANTASEAATASAAAAVVKEAATASPAVAAGAPVVEEKTQGTPVAVTSAEELFPDMVWEDEIMADLLATDSKAGGGTAAPLPLADPVCEAALAVPASASVTQDAVQAELQAPCLQQQLKQQQQSQQQSTQPGSLTVDAGKKEKSHSKRQKGKSPTPTPASVNQSRVTKASAEAAPLAQSSEANAVASPVAPTAVTACPFAAAAVVADAPAKAEQPSAPKPQPLVVADSTVIRLMTREVTGVRIISCK